MLDDDPVQLDSIAAVTEAAGHRTTLFTRAQALISALRKDTFDLLIVDWNLPDRSGLEVLAWARTNLSPAPPMLLVTSRVEDEDIVEGLNAGADDYLAKPLSPRVLEARINALLRRAYPQSAAPDPEVFGDMIFNEAASSVTRLGATVVLTTKEYALALLLFRNLHRALSRTYIVEMVWGNEPSLNSRSVDMHISRIRAKLGLRPERGLRLVPIYGYGYRLERLDASDVASLAAASIEDREKG